MPPAPELLGDPTARPMAHEPMAHEPVARTVAHEPVARPVAHEPVARTTAHEPVTRAAAREPVARPVANKPAAREPVARATARDAAVQDMAVGVGISGKADGLGDILRPGCAAAIWRREPPPAAQAWLDALAPERLPSLREVDRPEAVRDLVSAACDAVGTPAGAGRDWLIGDIADLSALFARLLPAPYQRVRLAVVTGDACRRFHLDTLTARLLCTYRGPGTQYGISADGEAPGRVHSVPTGAPVVLRGALWAGDRRSGLLHRSPPIQGSGQVRLVLVLDPMDAPEED